MLLTNQIVGFFVHQFVQKESVIIVEFFRGGSHQREVASEANDFGSVLPGIPSHVQTCRCYLCLVRGRWPD